MAPSIPAFFVSETQGPPGRLHPPTADIKAEKRVNADVAFNYKNTVEAAKIMHTQLQNDVACLQSTAVKQVKKITEMQAELDSLRQVLRAQSPRVGDPKIKRKTIVGKPLAKRISKKK
jgi:hypothetical protein